MYIDHRGRCRFGYKGYRAEVGKSGTVNITVRDKTWGEESAGSRTYKRLMSDPEFVSKLFWAQTAVRRNESKAKFWREQAVS